MSGRVLIRYGLGALSEELRARAPAGWQIERASDEEDFQEKLPHAEVVYGHLTPDDVGRAERLRLLQIQSTGIEHAQHPELLASGVPVCGIAGLLAVSVAEHAVALLLALSRGLGPLRDRQQERRWQVEVGCEIHGLRACILGYGAIGVAIAERLRPFGLHLTAVDPAPRGGTDLVDAVQGLDALPATLAHSNILIITCPRTPSTHHLIDAAALARLPTGAYVINVSRGGIIEEAALLAALNNGHLCGAALDVCEEEPYPAERPLWDAPRCLITAHSAGYSQHVERRKMERLLANLHALAADEPLVGELDLRPEPAR